MADLKKFIQEPARPISGSSYNENRRMNKARLAFDDKLDDLAVEANDLQFNYPGDKLDPETKVKIKGFAD